MNIVNINSPIRNTIIFYIIIFIFVILTDPKKLIKRKGIILGISENQYIIPISIINICSIIVLYLFFLLISFTQESESVDTHQAPEQKDP